MLFLSPINTSIVIALAADKTCDLQVPAKTDKSLMSSSLFRQAFYFFAPLLFNKSGVVVVAEGPPREPASAKRNIHKNQVF